MGRPKSRQRSQKITDKYNALVLSGMKIPESVYTQKRAQENQKKMADTSVPSLILSLSVSTVFTMLVATTYNIVDTYFVSDLGESAVAAVGLMFSVMALIQAVGYTWGMGAGSEISRLLGEQKKREAERILATALAGGVVSGVIISVIFVIYKAEVISLIGATDTSLDLAEQYGIYIIMAAPVMCGAYVLNNALRAAGQPYLALMGIAAGGVTNAVLDYVFIKVLDLGIAAAGIATLAGQSVSCIIMYLCIRAKICVVRLHIGDLWGFKGAFGVVRTGLPSFFRQGLMCVSAVFLTRSCRQYGDAVLANITVANKIFAVVFAVLVGYGQGFAPVCGFAYGAKMHSRVRKALNFTMATSAAFMILMGILSYTFAGSLCALFIDGAELGTFSAKAHALSMPFSAVCLVMGMYYQAVGAYGKATLISSMRQGIFFIPLIWLLPMWYGEYGVAVVQAAADILSGITAAVFWFICQRNFRRQMKSSLYL